MRFLLVLLAAVLAHSAAADCVERGKDRRKLTDLEIAWRPIAEQCYAGTEDPEVRELDEGVDPNAWAQGEGAKLLLLGYTIEGGTSAKEWKLENHAEKVGATLVMYWVTLDSARTAAPQQGERVLSTSNDGSATLSAPRGGGWALGSGAMKVTTGVVTALYLRDCDKAACPTPEARPALGDLRNCAMPRCAVPPPPHQRWYHRIDAQDYPATAEAAVERIDGAQFDALVDQRFPKATMLGNTVLIWNGSNLEGIRAQAMRVGATHALWWVEQSPAGLQREFVVFIRDCDLAACKAP